MYKESIRALPSISPKSRQKTRNSTITPRISQFFPHKSPQQNFTPETTAFKTISTNNNADFPLFSSQYQMLSKYAHNKTNSTLNKENKSNKILKLKIKRSIINCCDKIVINGTLNLKLIKDGKHEEKFESNRKRNSILEVRESVGEPEVIIEKIDNYYNSTDKENFLQTFYNSRKMREKSSFESIKQKLNLKDFSTEKSHQLRLAVAL